jgi:putative transposase
VVAVQVRKQLVEQLLADAGDDVGVLGPEGLLAQLTKDVLEAALGAELSAHLGYEMGDPAGKGSGNSRNGATPKMVHTEHGSVELDVPRDRNGTFEPAIVPKHATRLAGLEERILGMYAGGMTVRDIRDQLEDIYGVDMSRDAITKITDAVWGEVREWQSRPLDRVYPVVYLDAIVCKVRDDGVVRNKAAHIALGVDVEGRKQVLGVWIEANEGAKFWLKVMNELRARGVEDVLVLVCDGLKGLPEAVEAVWPRTWVQTCIVHLVRASLALCSYKDRKRVAAALKAIYRADGEDGAAEALEAFDAEWGRRYPGITRMWRDAWERVIPFLVFPPEIRKVLYTTNALESVNYQLRKVTKNRGHFPNDNALMKLLYLAVRNMEKKGRSGMGVSGTYSWKEALNQFHIFFPGRLDTVNVES